jgi:hypothetical protein
MNRARLPVRRRKGGLAVDGFRADVEQPVQRQLPRRRLPFPDEAPLHQRAHRIAGIVEMNHRREIARPHQSRRGGPWFDVDPLQPEAFLQERRRNVEIVQIAHRRFKAARTLS